MKELFIGTDVGSTTVKIICLDEENNVIYSVYQRHFSDVKGTSKKLFEDFFAYIEKSFGTDITFKINVTGCRTVVLLASAVCPLVDESI